MENQTKNSEGSATRRKTRGAKVKIMKGDLAGVEGILATMEGNTYVTLCLQGILSATIKVPKSYLKTVE